MNWLYKNWSKSTIFVAIYLAIVLFLFLKDDNYPLFLIWMQMVVYLLHQFEEYILPGGFKEFFNIKMLGSKDDQEPLSEAIAFWINVPVIFIAYPVTAILAQFVGIGVGLWTAYFSIINAASHVIIGTKHKYNPGFVVSLLLNIPFGIYTVWYLNAHDLIGVSANIVGVILGIAVQAVVMFFGFAILKPRVKANQNK